MENRVHGDDPKTYDKMISDIDSEKWLEAMRPEIDLMHSNQVWTLVDPPEGMGFIPSDRSTSVQTLLISMDSISDFMASSHF